MKKVLRMSLFALLVIAIAREACATSAVSIDETTGLLIFDADGVQFVNWNPSQLKINGTQLVATGKTVSFANSVAFTGTDGKTVTLNGNLTIGSNTTINGAGFTLTLPATGTAAIGAGTLAVTTSNDATIANHTHAITTSSNPGAAASILASNSTGYLQLVRLGIGVSPTQPLHVAGNVFIDTATANLYMKDTSSGFQVASSQVITPQSGNAFRNTSFSSGVSGWNVSDAGNAEFNNVRVRGELAASVFKVSELSATAGTFGVFYSASTLSSDALMPAGDGAGYSFTAKNSDAGAALFAVGDVVRIKSWTGAGISDTWGTVNGRTNNGTTTTYTAVKNSGSNSVTFLAGTAVIDYGPSGTGFITLSTDGTVGSSPNLTMATHDGSPWSATTNQLRLGNLNGSYGYATDVYGLGAGQYGAASKIWFTIDQTNGFRIGNNATVLGQWDTLGNVRVGQSASNQANVFISSAGTMSIRRGTTDYITLSTTDAQFTNLIKMSGSSAAISLGSTPPTSATTGTGVWFDRTGLYALSSNTQNTVLDSTGLKAGGGNIRLDSTGLTMTSASTDVYNSILWKNGSSDTVGIVTNYIGGINVEQAVISKLPTSQTTWFSTTSLSAVNNVSGHSTVLGVYKMGTAAAANADKGYAVLSGGSTFLGFTVGSANTPAHMLDVYGDARIFTNSAFPPLIVETGSAGGPSTEYRDGAGTQNKWRIGSGVTTATDGTFFLYDARQGLVRMQVSTAGLYRFNAYGAGTLNTDASGNITASSDERLKDIDGPFTRSLADLINITPVLHHWKESTGLDRTEQYASFSAQNLLPNIPEAVSVGSDGFYTVSDRVVLLATVNAIKELNARLAKLEGPNAPGKDNLDRKKIAEDRIAGLKVRLEQRQAAESGRHKGIGAPSAIPKASTTTKAKAKR